MTAGPAPAAVRRPGMRRGTRTGMALLNLAYLCGIPVFWFAWSQRAAFNLPVWAEDAAGFTGGILPVLMFAAGWCAAARWQQPTSCVPNWRQARRTKPGRTVRPA